MKNKKIIILVSVILVVIVPIFINLSFKVYLAPLFTAEWGAGDLLSYYGSLLGGIITLFGVVMTLNYQTKQSEKDDLIKYKPILKIASVENTHPEFIGRHEFRVYFPVQYSKDDINKKVIKSLFEKQMESVTSFHMILENKGRGEAVDVSLNSVNIAEVSWDDESNICITSSTPLSMGDILVNEKVDIIITFPNYLFLKDDTVDQNNILIELKISYNDMFRRSERELKLLLDFQIAASTAAPAPCFYKHGFTYCSVETTFVGMAQLQKKDN
ncbi:hypothetical protein U5M32_07950 [Streptococcus sp. TATVAM-FAB35]|uniref:hypothetical protein n=1 Tax=Streptococcus TaxID=1301 RepID=UPI0039808402